jgi:uncharacterized membrane protein
MSYQHESANGNHNGNGNAMGLARGMGWFSLGLGLAEVLAPRSIARCIGVNEHPGIFRALGLREIASGVGILTSRRPAAWMWSRVCGDLMDLSLLVGAMRQGHDQSRARMAAAVVAGATAVDYLCSRRLSEGAGKAGNGAIHLVECITINRSPEELYQFWRSLENLPQFMTHLHSVEVTDSQRSHWVAKGPAGSSVEWDAEIINDHPNELIAWRSLEDADVNNAGSVRFEPARGGRGTLVKVDLQYRPPAGKLGAAVAKVFGESPEKQIHVDLHRLKQVMETGEIATTEGQPAGRRRSTSRKYDDWVRS